MVAPDGINPQVWALPADVTALARDLGCPLVTGTRGYPGLGVPLVTV